MEGNTTNGWTTLYRISLLQKLRQNPSSGVFFLMTIPRDVPARTYAPKNIQPDWISPAPCWGWVKGGGGRGAFGIVIGVNCPIHFWRFVKLFISLCRLLLVSGRPSSKDYDKTLLILSWWVIEFYFTFQPGCWSVSSYRSVRPVGTEMVTQSASLPVRSHQIKPFS